MSPVLRAATIRAAWPALLLAVIVTLPWLGARDLWAPDEPRYAEVAREALVDGKWWYPHVNGRPYPDKPPLYFWLAAAASAPAGDVTELTARIPSAAAALLLVLVVVDLGSRILGADAGRVAGLVMATTWLAAWMSRRVNLDVLLSLCVAGCLWCGMRAAMRSRAGGWSRGSVAWMAGAGGAAALGVMTKGPVALVFLAAALIPMAMQARREGSRVSGLAKAATGVAFLVVLAAWLVPAKAIGGYDPLAVMKVHVFERAAEGRDHVQPFWYFARTLPLDFMPWTLLAIPALWSAWKARREPHVGWLLSWALAPVVVLSIVVEKRNIYVLPLLPAWALLVGWWAARGPAEGSRALRLTSALAAGLASLVAAAAIVAPRSPQAARAMQDLANVRGVLSGALATGVLGLVGAATIALALRRRAAPSALAFALAATFAVLETGAFALLPRFDDVKSGREMGRIIAREVGGAPLGMYPRTWDAYVFYSRRTMADLTGPEEASAWLARSARPAYVLAYRKHASVVLALPQPAIEVAHDTVGHREVVLWKFAGASP